MPVAAFENASLIEALLSGADGAWGGLPKSAAIIGHASLGELIANLVRAGKRIVYDEPENLLTLYVRATTSLDAGS